MRAPLFGDRLRAGLRLLTRWFPWTPLGLLVGVGALLGLRAIAYAQFDMVWLVTAHLVIALCLLSPLVVWIAGGLIALWGLGDESEERLHFETGHARVTGMRVPALSLLPLVQVRWSWVAPVGAHVDTVVERGHCLERARLADRGRHAGLRRLFVVEDPFGLGRVSFERAVARQVEVAPHLGRLSVMPSLTALASGDDMPHPMGVDDGDRLELSRYVPGDPARFIHWKLYARTRQLMVRRPERSLSIARRVAAFMLAGPGDDASAAIARLTLQRGLLGDDWTFGTDAHPVGTSRVDEATAWLLASSADRARGGEGLSAFVEAVGQLGPASLILFAPPVRGPWLARACAVAGRARVRVLIGTDGVAPVEALPWWRRLLLRAPASPVATPEAQLEQVVQALGASGCEVVVVDRVGGRVLSESHRRAMVGVARAGVRGGNGVAA